MLSNDQWIEKNFENADLKDKRLNMRLCKTAQLMGRTPEASLPKQMADWADIKGAYRFFANENVTHKRIQEPHRAKIMKMARIQNSVTLFYQDTSELDYTALKASKGLGPIGNHSNQGLMIHNCIAVQSTQSNATILGLAHQQVWRRDNISLNKTETRHQRNLRGNKESAVWSKTLRALKRPPVGCVWISVGDRASDIYEYHKQVLDSGWHSTIRACQERAIKVSDEKYTLMKRMRSLPAQGERTIDFRGKNDPKIQTVHLYVSWEFVEILPPARLGKNAPSIPLWAIRTWNEERDLEWILLSTMPVNCLEDAIEKIEFYEGRWIVEEFHKCLKSGCKIESRQLGTAKCLINYLAIASIIAILMLYLRGIARTEPNQLAREVIPEAACKIICKRYTLQVDTLTTSCFWRSVARLGGFIGRKSDGEPGWQTLWDGWMRLLDMLWAVESLQSPLSTSYD